MNIYMDNAATTKPLPSVIKEINRYLENEWYNPSSLYLEGVHARKSVDAARATIAKLINVKPSEIYFTSGGSESNSWALHGFTSRHHDAMILTTNIEHKSVIRSATSAGMTVPMCVDRSGKVTIDKLEEFLSFYHNKQKSILVSIQFANNEIGTIQDIKQISEITHKYNAILHTDAVQAFPHIPIDCKTLGIDMMSVSGHKFGAPKGIGFLYVSDYVSIDPIIYGTQENGMRGGTENVPYIMGMAEAAKQLNLKNNLSVIGKRDYMIEALLKIGCSINGDRNNMLPNIISCTLPIGFVGEYVIYMLSNEGINVSAGSACNLAHPSYVLEAIGLTTDEIQRTIRFSISDDISYSELDYVINTLKTILGR